MIGWLLYQYCKRYPENAKKLIRGGMYKELQSVMSKVSLSTKLKVGKVEKIAIIFSFRKNLISILLLPISK